MLYIHGYTESAETDNVRNITNAYLTNGGYNTLVLDWSVHSHGSYLSAFEKSIFVGKLMAKALLDLFGAGLSVDNFHLVGFSLGAQMASVIGREVQLNSNPSILLARITALDPAGPWSDHGDPIDPSDGRFVDVIHTDAGFVGRRQSGGHVDFWPNAGTRYQPGCPFAENFFSVENRKIIHKHCILFAYYICGFGISEGCNHIRAWQLWSESVANSENVDTFSAVQAKDWESFERGDIDNSRVVSMGVNCPKE